MPFFKKNDGTVFEVSEDFAEQVLRKQKNFEEVSRPEAPQKEVSQEEVIEEPKPQPVATKKKVVKKKK